MTGWVKMLNYRWLLMVVGVGLLLWFQSGLCLAASADAGENTSDYQLKEMVVTATREEVPADAVASTITVISRQELERLPATTVADVLRFVPGVYVAFEGNGPGAYATATIQGSEVRHVAVYADGVPLNLQANPLTHLSYLPVEAIERIEVYKGAASAAWGTSLGGVINIVTREPETKTPFSGGLRASYGEARTFRSRGHIQGRVADWGYFLALTRERSDGFEDHSEYDQRDGYGRLDYDLPDAGQVSVACGHNDGDINDPVLSFPDFWDDMSHERSWQRLRYTGYPAVNDGESLLITVEAWHRQFEGLIEDVYVDHRDVYSDYEEEAWGGALRLTWQSPLYHQVTAGFDGEWGDYHWQNYIQSHDTGNWAMFVNDTCTVGPWSLNTGLRYDKNREFDLEVSPSLGVVYRWAGYPALVRAQVARGFSAPPNAWINDPYAGNPDLDPEIAWNWQVGAEADLLPFLRLALTGFYADVKDIIQPNWVLRRYINIDEVTRQGVEGGLFADFENGLRLSVSGSFVDVEDEATGETVKDIPREQYQITVGYAGYGQTHSLSGVWVDHNSSYGETRDRRFVFDYQVRADLADLDLPGVPLSGLKRYGDPALFSTVHNLFNTRYLYRNSWPQPGRWVEAGIQMTF